MTPERAKERKMPFGKHKGLAISECPISYLDWLIGEEWFAVRFPNLKAEIEDYLNDSPEWQRM